MYLFRNLSNPANTIHAAGIQWTRSRKLTFSALLAALAAIFQSAGGLFPGIGYLVSPFATMPVLFTMMMSFRYGVFGYFLTMGLLLFIQPSELMIYPLTTGFLGLSLGWGFRCLKYRIYVILFGGFLLFAGICILLYGLHFPVLGPAVSNSFDPGIAGMLLSFSIAYSWLWTELSFMFMRKFVIF